MKRTAIIMSLLGGSTFLGACMLPPQAIDFGTDSWQFSNDGECDDPRFSGPGVWEGAAPELIRRDASDCRTLYEMGAITYNGG